MPTRRRTHPVQTPAPVHTSGLATRDPHPMTADDMLSLSLGNADISISVPADATLPQVEETIKLAIGGHRLLMDAAEKIKPLIGRLLLVIQERTLYKPDFPTFTEYLEQRVVVGMGMSRSSAFDALKIARTFPSMTAKDYATYGASRLLLATQVTNEADPGHKTILDQAVRMPVDQFKDQIKLAKSIDTAAGPGEAIATMTSISIKCPVAVRDRWQELLNSTGLAAADLLMKLMDHESKPSPATASAALAQALSGTKH